MRRIGPRAPLLVAALTIVSLLPAGARGDDAPPAHDGKHVLVRFKAGTPKEKEHESHRKHRTTHESSVDPERIEVVKVSRRDTVEAAVARYKGDPDVEFAEPNYVYSVSQTPNDTYFSDLWGLSNSNDADVDAPEGWALTGAAAGAPWPTANYTVGIVDTGISVGHPDLAGKVVTPCYSALAGRGTLSSGCNDGYGHGTHVAGTVAAVANNGTGVAGVAFNAKVYMCKALSDSGSGYDIDVVACVNELVSKRDAYNLRVISMSLGGASSSAMQAAVDNAWNNGVLVVAAAGNSGSSKVSYPAGFGSVVSVGATDRSDKKASFSQYNSDVEVSAPGVGIYSTYTSGYRSMSGTSMATPHAAAVAAVIFWKTGETGSALRSALGAAVDDLGSAGRDTSFGFGRVNLCKALAGGCTYATGTPPTVTPAPTPAGTGNGTLAGVAYSGGVVRSGVKVIANGGTKSVTYTASNGSYAFSLPPRTYTVNAKYGKRTCYAGSPSGSKYANPSVTSGVTSTVNWYC